ncbi:MAG: ATP-binding protein [Vulcanimicrobiaceae bacterium]
MATRAEPGPPLFAHPSGTVTFLFSDIEGSTERWERDRDAMGAALTRHDALMREALQARGGYIFKTIGDAFCAAFFTAPDAVAAAHDAQRALAAEDFSAVGGVRVRMALHTGTVEERDGDYFGPPVNRVARLLAAGHGGQVLISGTAANLLRSDMPPQMSLRDLGEHRLRDLAYPEHVYQLLAPDLQESFPPLRSLDYLPNNLPRQLTSFVGRDEVLADIVKLVEAHPLVTLVGTGGVGKTRCAIQVGAEFLNSCDDGVWHADLAPVSDPTFIANVVAQALNVQEQPNRPLLDTVVSYLKRKRLLLILDSCEHAIEEAGHVAGAILRDCPEVRILATSRERLNISGEATYRMPALGVPPNAQMLFAEGSSRYGAVQLFVDRAILSNNRFTLTEENAPYVAEICRRLDGVPLAIELAAARLNVLSPQLLARKLDERFSVLTGGDRSALPRRQTMRALIDWSYDLLSNRERTLFRELSIFGGGFTLETATAVCSKGDMEEIVVLDLLASLVDKSLVQAEPVRSGTRYRLLESMREYAREKLTDAGEADAVARAHARAFVSLAEQLDGGWETTPDRDWLAQVEPEMENFRAALAWAFGAKGDALLGQRLAGTLRRVLWPLAVAEGGRWVQIAQKRVDGNTPTAVVAALDLAEAQLAQTVTQSKASLAAAERALERSRKLADPLLVAEAELRAGQALVQLGRIAEGEALLHDALVKARALGARKVVSLVLRLLAFARSFAGDVAEARQLLGEALTTARACGAERQTALIANNLAEDEFQGGNPESALRLAREALTLFRAFHDAQMIATALCNETAYLVASRRYDEARLSAREALTATRDAEYSVGLACALQHMASTAALRPGSDVRRAARLLGYVDARFAALEALREYTEQHEYDAVIPALRDALGAAELSKLIAEGSTWSEDRAVAEAMLV